jgi:outer membrane receptor protein involved in Fe transport
MLRVLILLCLLVNIDANAQLSSISAGNSINGLLVDSVSDSVLPYANITLHTTSDSSFVNGAASRENGAFEITGVNEGNYFLKISFVGYDTKYIPGIKLTGNNANMNLGTIALSKSAYELSETEIVGEKVGEELHLDKKVINVSQNLNAQGGTALDVLQNQPSVRVDPDGTVYLRGSSNFIVQVNGKPFPLQGSDALRQISANTIDNVELITNPSARYDAEGSAGIININLKQTKDQSLSGIVNLNSGTGDKYNADGSFNYNLNGLSLNGGIDYRDNTYTNIQDIKRNTFLSNSSLFNYSQVDINSKRRQYSLRSGADYTFDQKNSTGLMLSIGKVDIKNNLRTNIYNKNNDGDYYSVVQNNQDIPVKYFNSTFTYQHKINPDVNDLNFEATYNHVGYPQERLINENVTDANFNPQAPFLNSTLFTNDTKINEGRAKLNYKHKFTTSTSFETGLQSNLAYRHFDIVNKIFDQQSQSYIVDPLLTNNFNLRNNVYAGFVSFNSEIEGFNYMLGLRGEYMDRLLDQKTLSETFTFSKMDYFPSVNISRKIDDHQLQLSYSRRINRPNDNMLNPFAFYTDPNITISGNPRLLPEYINAFELNYQKMYGSVFVSVQTYYRKLNDSFSQTFSVDSTGHMNIMFNNYGKSDVYGAEISSSFTIADIVRLDPSVNLFQTSLKGNADGKLIEKDFFNWGGRMNATVNFSPVTRLQLSGNYIKFVDTQSQSKPFMMISASLRQEFFDKALSLTLQARNLFKLSNMKISTVGSNFDSYIYIRPESPVFTLMLSYNFNNFKRSQRPQDTIDVPTGL